MATAKVRALTERVVRAQRVTTPPSVAAVSNRPKPRLAPAPADLLQCQPACPTSRRAIALIHRSNAEMCRLLIDQHGRPYEALSIALSDVVRDSARTPDSMRQYESAFVWFFEPVLAAYPDLFERLLGDVASARKTIVAALALQGFETKPSRYADGSFEARPRRTIAPDRRPSDQTKQTLQAAVNDERPLAATNVKRSTLALLVLKECFDALIMRGRWSEQNPLKVDRHEQMVRLMNSTPMPSWASPFARYAGNMFSLRGHEAQRYANRDTTFYKPTILEAARAFPPGIEFATRVAADVGARISEPLAVTVFDWVCCGATREIHSPNKGSRGLRTKTLILSRPLAEQLPDYIDGDRARFSAVSMKLVRKLAGNCANLSPAHADLLAEPLFLSPSGRQITPHLYRRQYFRPAMQRIGLPDITPHRLRHEHALRALLAIRRLSLTPEVEAARIEEYAMLQGWKSGAAMAHYYAPQFRQMTQRDLADALYADPQYDGSFCPIGESTADPLITRQQRELRQMFGEIS